MAGDGRYAALSHGWGTTTELTTTTEDTLPARERNINWNDLPRTFQDAIQIVRGLDNVFMDRF